MDYKNLVEIPEGVKLEGVKNFELPHIFDCGQCFRWNRQKNGNYIGVAFNRVIEVEKQGEDVMIYNTSKEDFESLWKEYFDLNRDYDEIKNSLSGDPLLKTAMDFGYGIRLLKQDPFEIIISFITSANNRIPMIKRAINKISEKWGEKITYKGETYYSFPRVEDLAQATQEELESCGLGFRAKYVKDTVDNIFKFMSSSREAREENEELKQYDIQDIKNSSDDDCHIKLQKFSGIGPKVADCIMLFSMEKYSAFPVDVWVKRAMQYFYLAPEVSLKKIREFARNKFGELSGFAQQYLFYYARENNINVDKPQEEEEK